MTNTWHVEITQDGPSGEIYYHEQGVSDPIAFYWEFGGPGGAIVYIALPPSNTWDTRYLWAQGRRTVIIERVGEEAVRQRAPGHKFNIENDITMYIR